MPATRFAKLSFFDISQLSSLQINPYSIPAMNVSPAPIELANRMLAVDAQEVQLIILS